MSGVWLISYIVLWVLVAFLVFFSLVVARQFGLVHSELGRIGSSSTETYADVGSIFPSIAGFDLEGHRVPLIEPDAKLTLIVVVSPDCGSCDVISPLLRGLHQKERSVLNVIVASTTDDVDATRAFVRRNKLDEVSCVLAPTVLTNLRISATPCGILVDGDGRTIKKSPLHTLANIREFERLVEVRCDGVGV